MKAVTFQINVILPEGASHHEIKERISQQVGSAHLISTETFVPSLKKAGGRKLIREFLRQRDGDNCCWCNLPMDFDNLGADTPLVPTFEHLVRRADGGGNTFENLKLAHKKCNNERHK